MFKLIDYHATRALQISVEFISTLAIEAILNFSHSGWIGFATMMIYAGFDSGTSLHRAKHRFWGAMLGLMLSFYLFLIIQLNDDIIWLVIPIILFLAYFNLSKNYVSPTIFTVTLTSLGSDYYQSDTYQIEQFFFDYGKATIISLFICLFFEYFVFKKRNLTDKFYIDLQDSLIAHLKDLFTIVTKRHIKQSLYLRKSTKFNSQFLKFETFLKTVNHNFEIKEHLFDDLEEFKETIEVVYNNIRQLFLLKNLETKNIVLATRNELDKLQKLCATIDENYEVSHAS